MLRNSIRRSSTNTASKSSSIPFQPVPINKYNQTRSPFNFKPTKDKSKNLQGLIYNPPASIFKPSKTPLAFLPPNDPRRLLQNKPTYTKDELNNYPIIQNYQPQNERDYSITPEIIDEIKRLRLEDPNVWTIAKLSTKFNISPHRINVFSGKLDTELTKDGDYQCIKPTQIKRKEERAKRVKLWLRNEF
ncbi:mitochondrial ribosomal protein subunit L20-domain-containing protein [Scheffersomyces coipomensis]|uniref:mitochondrial ribosomal protein subunit L20-domain-containing protein n=1 Tax=Scheffersomyces coipomensis TaxID=1788519 RepID=UPI00315D6947